MRNGLMRDREREKKGEKQREICTFKLSIFNVHKSSDVNLRVPRWTFLGRSPGLCHGKCGPNDRDARPDRQDTARI